MVGGSPGEALFSSRRGGGATTVDLDGQAIEQDWPLVTGHPFCREAGDGSLHPDAFERWMIADYTFNIHYRRFLAGLMTIAPTATGAEVVSLCLPPVNDDTTRIMATARRHGIDLDSGTGPTTISFVSYLQALLSEGYPVALAAFYMCQRIYYEAWSTVRADADYTTPYWPFIEAWSCDSYSKLIASLARLVNSAAPRGPSPGMRIAARRVVRFELSFWTAIYGGETW